MPSRGATRGIERFEAKLAAKEKRDAQRRRKLAMMTPEQRAKHEAWQASHMPGPMSERARRRQNRKSNELIGELLAKSDARRAAEEQRESALRAEILRDQKAAEDPHSSEVENNHQEPYVDVFA